LPQRGADGSVRLLTLNDLQTVKIAHVPGNAQRIDASCGWLHVLCLMEDDGLKSLLCRVPLRGERYEPVTTLPGIPGALRADDAGGLWVAASEMLYHFLSSKKKILIEKNTCLFISGNSRISGNAVEFFNKLKFGCL